MQTWITVRMDDGGAARVTVHASEQYRHPHEDYQGDENPNPTVAVSFELEAHPDLQAALQAALEETRTRMTGEVRLAAIRAELRAVDRTEGGTTIPVMVGGGIAPTGGVNGGE